MKMLFFIHTYIYLKLLFNYETLKKYFSIWKHSCLCPVLMLSDMATGIKPRQLEALQQNLNCGYFIESKSDFLYLYQKLNIVAISRNNTVVIARIQ